MSFIQRIINTLFRRSTEEVIDPSTKVEEVTDSSSELSETAPLSPDVVDQYESAIHQTLFSVGSAQSIGQERDSNEDSLLILTSTEIGEVSLPGFGLFCVADGAGGQGNGDLASALATRVAAHSMLKSIYLNLLDPYSDADEESLEESMQGAFESADQVVIKDAEGGATTLTLAHLLGDLITIGHVGDSRAYVIKNGEMELITRDHTVAWRLVEIDQLTPEEAREHPQRNQLWNALGKGSNLTVETYTLPVPKGGSLLLCSDGLWSEISEAEIVEFIRQFEDPAEACDAMVERANEAGGSDNITAVLVSFNRKYGEDKYKRSRGYLPL